MTTITEAQRVALTEAETALWSKHYAAANWGDGEDLTDYLFTQYEIIHDLVGNATVEAEDAPPLWRDCYREGWMRDETIHLELAGTPNVTVSCNTEWAASVMIADNDDSMFVEGKHLPGLIAMLQEVQRRIEGEDK